MSATYKQTYKYMYTIPQTLKCISDLDIQRISVGDKVTYLKQDFERIKHNLYLNYLNDMLFKDEYGVVVKTCVFEVVCLPKGEKLPNKIIDINFKN